MSVEILPTSVLVTFYDGTSLSIERVDDGCHPQTRIDARENVCHLLVIDYTRESKRNIRGFAQAIVDLDAQKVCSIYYHDEDGELHRDGGPALIHNYTRKDYRQEWFIHGKSIKKVQYENCVRIPDDDE